MGKIILTGDRPTGKLHVGHYVGSLRRRVELQNSGEFDKIYIMIADAQALTDNADNPEKVRQNILEVPEYAGRFIKQAEELNIEYKLNTMVMDISEQKIVTAMNREEGLFEIRAKAVILAMGCRERSRGALNIPGYRPAGIFSAGTAQRLVNIEGYMPGREVDQKLSKCSGWE